MSFLGKVNCNVSRLVAGSWEEIVLDYEVGASGIADGAWIKATFKFYSDWALFRLRIRQEPIMCRLNTRLDLLLRDRALPPFKH